MARTFNRRAAVALGLTGGVGVWIGLRDRAITVSTDAPAQPAVAPVEPKNFEVAKRTVQVTIDGFVPDDFAETLALDIALGAHWFFAFTFTPGPAGSASPGVSAPIPTNDTLNLRAQIGRKTREIAVPATAGEYCVNLKSGRVSSAPANGPHCWVRVAT